MTVRPINLSKFPWLQFRNMVCKRVVPKPLEIHPLGLLLIMVGCMVTVMLHNKALSEGGKESEQKEGEGEGKGEKKGQEGEGEEGKAEEGNE